MGLELRIIKDPCRDVPKPRVRAFGEQGGDVGRAADSYWVLPDPKGYISSQHCSVEYRDGAFWLRDTSRNGVYLNGAREPVGRGNAVPLQHGDRIRLAEYEVLVRLYHRTEDSARFLDETRHDLGTHPEASGNDSGAFGGNTGEHGRVDVESPGLNADERLPSEMDILAGRPLTSNVRTSGKFPTDQKAPSDWAGFTNPGIANEEVAAAAADTDRRSEDDESFSDTRTLIDSTIDRLRRGFRWLPRQEHAAQSERVEPAAGVVENASPSQFKLAILDRETMKRNRVLLGLDDMRALSAYKILRTRVRRKMLANHWRSIGASGAAEGAGKTLTAINLAVTFAQDVRSPCILVDVDLYRPNIASYLGLKCDKGLSDYLLGEADVADIVYSTPVSGLTVVPNVRPLQSASELLASQRMSDLVKFLEALRPEHTIIFDLPPLLMSDDVLLFAPHMDCVLDVVAVGVTPRASLEHSKEILAEFNVVGIVLNRATSQDKTSHYYY